MILFRGTENEVLGDRFRLLEEVGRGSFGEVWRAKRLRDGADVALKIPKDQELGEETLRKEPDLVMSLQHPHIVKVFGHHTIGDLFIIEMEYVDGYDLAHILDGVCLDSPLTFEQIIIWIDQVLAALDYVHSANVSHNDIKPQNILIEKSSNTAKLTDFGVSRRLEDVWVWTRRQGTEAYMAPEVALEGKRGRGVSDIYSVGVLMYEMVTGKRPYASPHELLTMTTLTKPRELNRDVPPELETIILSALERRPEKRYQNAASMRRDLSAVLATLRASKANFGALVRSTPTELGFLPPSSSPLYYLELAKRKLREGDGQAALEAAETAVDRSDEHPQYLRMLGGICVRLGYQQKAISAYERLLHAYDSGYPVDVTQRREVLERLGKLYTDTKRYAEAIRMYSMALAVSHNRAYAQFRLAVAYGLDGDYRRAIELLEGVRKDRPDAVVVYSKLAWAHALNGDDPLALSFYNQALVFDPHDTFSLYHLGVFYLKTGDKRRADEYFDRVLVSDNEGTYASMVKEIVSASL
jgi:tetratricopeptide (TPR) repeat protein